MSCCCILPARRPIVRPPSLPDASRFITLCGAFWGPNKRARQRRAVVRRVPYSLPKTPKQGFQRFPTHALRIGPCRHVCVCHTSRRIRATNNHDKTRSQWAAAAAARCGALVWQLSRHLAGLEHMFAVWSLHCYQTTRCNSQKAWSKPQPAVRGRKLSTWSAGVCRTPRDSLAPCQIKSTAPRY